MNRIRNRTKQKRHPGSRSGIAASLSYLKARRITLQYLAMIFAGVLFGSIYAAVEGVQALPCKILQYQLQALPQLSPWQLLQDRMLFTIIGILYLMIAGSCLWGRWLIPLLPFLFGVEQGTVITDLLLLNNCGGWQYIFLANVFPASLASFIWLLLCNYARSSCGALIESSTACCSPKKGAWLCGCILLLLFSALEAIMQKALI